MSLIFIDSFDHYGSIDPTLSGKWTWVYATGYFMPSTNQVRTGTHSLKAAFSGPDVVSILKGTGNIIFGFAFRTDTLGANPLCAVLDSINSALVSVVMESSGLLTVRRQDDVILGTSTTPVIANSWNYLEFKVVFHDTTGSVELRLNSTVEVLATNIDTIYTGTPVWQKVRIRANSGEFYLDDFYLADDTGSAPRNTFLGPVKIECLMPQTDAVAVGSNQGLTPSTGTDHGALVDEIPPNTTDYNGSVTVGAKDTYNYPNMALTGTILGVQINPYVSKTEAGLRKVCSVIRSNSVDYDGTDITPATTFAYTPRIVAQNPNGSVEWTTATVNAVQAGMKVTA